MRTIGRAVQIQRDGFARASLMRLVGDPKPCAWCGQTGKFYYFWEDDSGRVSLATKPESERRFCSVGCYRVYYS